MEKIIVGDITPYETRIAIIEGNVPTQLFYERSLEKRIIGNVYMGKVTNVLPGMQSAFVDIGIGKDVFLQVGDMNFALEEGEKPQDVKIQNYVRVGDMIPTQIIKDAVGNKGARASTCIALPGRFSVLVPSMKNIGVSKKIPNEKERKRLARIGKEVLPNGLGLIMRTISEGMTESDLKTDILHLVEAYDELSRKQKVAPEKTVIHEELPLSMKIVRDYFTDDVLRFALNNKEEYEKILSNCSFLTPLQRASLELYEGKAHIFEKFHIDKEIQSCLTPKVWLSSGGYIIIQVTEALVSIDVNTGKFTGKKNLSTTVYQTNLSAITEIARQIRLRNLAGIIIIDFIDMQNESHKRDVVNKLRLEFEKDPVKTQIFELTDLGLVQMTRHRIGKPIASVLQESCPYCEGHGRVNNRETTACKVFAALNNVLKKSRAKKVKVELHPIVADFIKSKYKNFLQEYQDKFRKPIKVSGIQKLHFSEYHIITL
ncbi:Rne/Rng family ribonuclease [Candidatus Riflebacteria bacterium]